MQRAQLAVVILSFFLVAPLFGAVYIVPSDRDLIRAADAILIGTVDTMSPAFTLDQEIVTEIEIRIERVLKGQQHFTPAGHSGGTRRFRITQPGGEIGSQSMRVSGAPELWPENRALLFLERRDDVWSVWGLELGKFDFVRHEGRELLVRRALREHTASWNPDLTPHEEPFRESEAFLEWVAAVAGGLVPGPPQQPRRESSADAASADYLVQLTDDQVESLQTTYPPSAYTQGNFRWRVFDQGQSVTFRQSGTQPGYDATGAAQRGLAAWTNDPGSNISLVYGGTTTAGFTSLDGINAIVFNSSSDVPSGSLAYARWYSSGTHTYKGETFNSITEGDVVVRSNISISQKVFEEAVTHELGHTLGFRHSDQSTPSSTQAVMKAVLSGNYGATLGPWDIDAARTVYTGSSTAPPGWVAPTFTDDPLVPRVTIIKAVHLAELRTAINNFRAHAGLPAFSFTDPAQRGVVVKAVHVQEMRTALSHALTALGRTSTFTDPGLTRGTTIRAVHFQELRNYLK